jgi:hypothetical protein
VHYGRRQAGLADSIENEAFGHARFVWYISLNFQTHSGRSEGWRMALVVDKELIEIIQSNLLVNDILMSAVLLISVAISFVNRKNFK